MANVDWRRVPRGQPTANRTIRSAMINMAAIYNILLGTER